MEEVAEEVVEEKQAGAPEEEPKEEPEELTAKTCGFVRMLHWIIRVGDRPRMMNLLLNVLQMKIMRHSEYREPDAPNDGPYSGRWSKTMMAYGSEVHNFALEVVHSYEKQWYSKGNDLAHIDYFGDPKEVARRAEHFGFPFHYYDEDDSIVVSGPDEYNFRVWSYNENSYSLDIDLLRGISINVTNIKRACRFYQDALGMFIADRREDYGLVVHPGDEAAHRIVFHKAKSDMIDFGGRHGRLAIGTKYPAKAEELIRNHKGSTIITPVRAVKAAGETSFDVVIVSDADGFEYCLIDYAGFANVCKPQDGDAEFLRRSVEEELQYKANLNHASAFRAVNAVVNGFGDVQAP